MYSFLHVPCTSHKEHHSIKGRQRTGKHGVGMWESHQFTPITKRCFQSQAEHAGCNKTKQGSSRSFPALIQNWMDHVSMVWHMLFIPS